MDCTDYRYEIKEQVAWSRVLAASGRGRLGQVHVFFSHVCISNSLYSLGSSFIAHGLPQFQQGTKAVAIVNSWFSARDLKNIHLSQLRRDNSGFATFYKLAVVKMCDCSGQSQRSVANFDRKSTLRIKEIVVFYNLFGEIREIQSMYPCFR